MCIRDRLIPEPIIVGAIINCIISNNLFSRNLDIVLEPPSTNTNLKPKLFICLYIRFVKFLSGNL